ncbi:DegT/DnrJ/EryC1/StrS family aminotransferase [Jannaschia sp. KMU-145]|uniref:DegT/DnrJ/EryC1/StrS family aminotransferase n=1 Tax=Jannaschia halovivens TaxID=3388667 RepID=UPI00396B3FAD
MPDTILPLATSSWDQAEHDAMQRVIASGFYSMGKEVRAFEEQFAAAMGSKHCVMVNSGSSANLLIVGALRYHSRPLMPGDEVIVPAVSWSTSYYPFQQYGCHVKFVDIDADTLNYDLDALEAAVTDKTRLILVVNLLGNPNDFNRIDAIVGGRDILVMEDNCESMGATLGGKQCGTFGIAGSYSSFFSHHISTMEGGLVCTDDEELYHIMLSVRAHGWTRNLPSPNHVTGTKGDDPFTESFRFVLPGYNLRPLEMSGALGQAQIAKLPMLVRERRANADRFRAMMQAFPKVRMQQEIGENSWFGFSMVLDPSAGVARKVLVNALTEAGIECRPIVAGNFARNEVVEKHFDYSIHGELANADLIDAHGLFIGNQHYPLDDAFAALAGVLRRVFA